MATLVLFLRLAHFIGLGLALGAATTKLALLLKSRTDHAFVPTYVAVAGSITRLILVGTALLVLSGIVWFLVGYPLGGLLVVKIILVAMVFVVGGSMDKLVEPKFHTLAPKPGDPVSPEFIRIQKLYLVLEALATGLYYVVVVMWVLR